MVKHIYTMLCKNEEKEKGRQQLPEMHTTKACNMSCNRLTVVTGFYSDGLSWRTVPYDLQHVQIHTIKDFLWKKCARISLFIQLVTLNDVNTEKAFVLN